ncbi:MAG: Type secretory pathway, VirB2 component (pilins) [Rickettsiaceae bacterium]|jgi:type IV secretory pathway VirB2 component (pilin)|nr:Type secretory pathway, VirB2 component (pilins) [Rickettsiaceae bacterium]
MNKLGLNIRLDEEFFWRLLITFSVIFAIISACDSSFASGAAATENDVIGSTLCRLVQNLTGGIARSIATIAIFAVGIGLFMGKLNWGVAAATAAGVGIIFGAAQMVAWLSGNADNAECPIDSNI